MAGYERRERGQLFRIIDYDLDTLIANSSLRQELRLRQGKHTNCVFIHNQLIQKLIWYRLSAGSAFSTQDYITFNFQSI